MRPVTFFLVALLVVAFGASCGVAAPAASTQPPAATPTRAATQQPTGTGSTTATFPPTATLPPAVSLPPTATPPPAAITPPPSTPAPGGQNTLTYEITGEYEASGEAVFDEAGSNYTEEGFLDIFREGWTAYFENEAAGHTIRVETRADDMDVEFFGGEVVVRADGNPGSDDECTFTITKNDATGPVGSAVCERAVLHPNGSTYVRISIEWEVNL